MSLPMPAPAAILDLVSRFGEHIDAYKSGGYNETQLRRDFLDPLFKLLGWDIDNTAGYDEAYRDVIHEDQVKVGGAVKAPDYGFRIGGARKFFLEAKKPSVRIKDDVSPAYQLRRYAWSAKLPLSVLSDFEEFAVYDTRIKPQPNDPASKARIFYCRFDEYAEKWDFICGTFSREAILKGSFDKFAAANKGKRGTAEVDADFLATIEGWRADLARNLALRNPALTQRELNFAVQRILDRIIFLRICEDRGIEDYERLKRATEAKAIYPELVKLFQQADDRYNSGLFHFRSEKGRHEEHDTLTPHLVIDDKLLKGIVTSLYYPASPYEFSVLSADILGQVYEQFLGKVITLSAGHRAQVEDKPEVKKAGGVFYTPAYIVDYIVRQTVGPLIESKTPKQIEKLTVLDPACGSGSFLIGAYQFLLDWYHRYYTTHEPETHAKGKAPKLVAASGGGWALTTTERKRILITHIYGVDIDSQAVEVTKLSLLLKVLEGETAQTVQRELIHERVLPDLGDNIKCGNSLIASDFYSQPGLAEMDTEAHLRLNVFDWDGKDGFPEIMKRGGFDAVIGNPPYVRIQTLPSQEVAYLTARYPTASAGNCDLYISFVEQAHRLLHQDGQLGFIIPNKFLRTDYGLGLRRLLSEKKAVERLVDFGASQVFKATTYTCILVVQKSRRRSMLFGMADARRDSLENVSMRTVGANQLTEQPWTFESNQEKALNARLSAGTIRLLDLPADMGRGSSTGDDEVFVVAASSHDLEPGALRTPLFASDFSRYSFHPQNKWRVLFPYDPKNDFRLYDEAELKKLWPKAYSHLKSNEAALRRRKGYKEWFSFSAPRNLVGHENAQIAIPLLADRGMFAMIPASHQQTLCPMASGGFTLTISPTAPVRPEFVLGLLNSKLLFWRLRGISNVFRGGWITCTKQYLGELPIRIINPRNPADRAAHDRIVKLVEQMLKLHQERVAAKTPHERTVLDRQISATDATIDREVYALYGITEDEIAVVEGREVIEVEAPALRHPKSTDEDGSTAESYGAAAHHHGMIFREDPPVYRAHPEGRA